MTCFDLFNGDADGIFALIQLRKAVPTASTLISGVKRDIKLLERISPSAGDKVTVLDVSADSNQTALERVLASGAKVDYFDHHKAETLPHHPNLEAHINTSRAWCTSLLVDRYLEHGFSDWAIAGAYGDNLHQIATQLGQRLSYNEQQLAQLQRLGELVNYNGYGLTLDDLCFDPITLYQRLYRYNDALAAATSEELVELERCYQQDQAQAEALTPIQQNQDNCVYLLPEQPWARRLSGTLANQLQQQHPLKAIALLLSTPHGYQVSLRVPAGFKRLAGDFCSGFDTGGGRALAGGINRLPETQLADFMKKFTQQLVRD